MALSSVCAGLVGFPCAGELALELGDLLAGELGGLTVGPSCTRWHRASRSGGRILLDHSLRRNPGVECNSHLSFSDSGLSPDTGVDLALPLACDVVARNGRGAEDRDHGVAVQQRAERRVDRWP